MLLLLAIAIALYVASAVLVTFSVANMNHMKRPGLSEFIFGLVWLPAILLLAFAHWRYKFKYKVHK